MTDETMNALRELAASAKQKIRIGDAVIGIVELRGGAIVPPKSAEPDPKPIDDGGVPFKSFGDELKANGWTAIHEPDGTMEQGSCK